jgi:Recombinase
LPAEVRARIAADAAAGMALQAIADALNAEAIPTARGGRWFPSTVRHIVRSVALDVELEAARRSV